MSQIADHRELAEQESAILDYLDGLLAEEEAGGAHLRLVHPSVGDASSGAPQGDDEHDLPADNLKPGDDETLQDEAIQGETLQDEAI
ncbi:MAG: hypothetical protein ACLFQH_05410, partial [Halothiobacillaceae bacterium]